MNFALALKVSTITKLAAGDLAMISSIYSPTFASDLEISGIYSSSLTGDAEIPEANTKATGEAQFESNAQADALGKFGCRSVVRQ
jgi:hypothetical protein